MTFWDSLQESPSFVEVQSDSYHIIGSVVRRYSSMCRRPLFGEKHPKPDLRKVDYCLTPIEDHKSDFTMAERYKTFTCLHSFSPAPDTFSLQMNL